MICQQSKIAIVTGSTPGYLGAVGEQMAMSTYQYALKHCIEHVFGREFDASRPPSWSKVKFLLAQFDRGFEYLLWLDGDVLALEHGPHPDLLFRDGGQADFFVAIDENGINCGVMGIRVSQSARQALEWVWAQTKYIDHPWWEQRAVHELHQPVS